ncbi:MAG: hypothetical protein F6K31_07835 [Symploca sp. SIO2G7]|nr:hypothetical protein [Symploca sp. SIO2G7]
MNTPETSQSEAYIDGLTDGSHGYPFNLKFMHHFEYMSGYVEGLIKWRDELLRREQTNLELSAFEF